MADQSSSSIVLSVITEFCAEFRTVIDGNTNDLSLNELSGGARISFVFHELFNQGIKTIDPFDQVKDGDIRTILYNSSVRAPEDRLQLLYSRCLPGFDSSTVRRHDGIRSHCQAADQAIGGSQSEVLPTRLR